MTCSYIAWPTPCAIPPWTCPSTSSGLIWRPQSSTATKRLISASPVSLSISTTQICVPKGKTQASGSQKTVVSRPGSIPGASVLERLAAAATSPKATDFCVPAPENLPSSKLTSETLASNILAAICFIFSFSLCAAVKTAEPPTAVVRLPYVPRPSGVELVSPCTTRILLTGIVNSSATIWANVVSSPCPCGDEPV